MSQEQAQVDALEHLLMAVLKTSKASLPTEVVFEAARSSLAGSDGPPGTEEKTAARKYLDHLKLQVK
ncbi:hypothetical protein [Pseudomonas sp. Irchel 3F5]|uniref:hypothetical protein n=1 Tax=Pseudomonas sp. Irchel 3F5 TaxID=2009002 RepID=UPI000BA4BE5C|nr:hypothetical protein [Pseudomonas sp. Irchel 3F5]